MSEGPRSERRLLYADTRAYALPETLEELTGPTSGPVDLPPTIAWTGRTRYVVDDAADLGVFYERVLEEASGPDDLRAVLNGAVLVSVWQRLFLPVRVRLLWEGRFPQLGRLV